MLPLPGCTEYGNLSGWSMQVSWLHDLKVDDLHHAMLLSLVL
jgi:hypothetical protein